MTTIVERLIAAKQVIEGCIAELNVQPEPVPPPVVTPPQPTVPPPFSVPGNIPGYKKTWNLPLVIPAAGTEAQPQILNDVTRADAVIASFTMPSGGVIISFQTYDSANSLKWSLSEGRWDFSSTAIERGQGVNVVRRYGGDGIPLIPGRTYYLNAALAKQAPATTNAGVYFQVAR